MVMVKELDLKSLYPTDRGHFEEKVCDSIKRSILLFGPCKPIIEFKRDDKNRCFSQSYYNMITKSGSKIPRSWLCYSMILDKAYCESCWLFADRGNANFRCEWILGIDDWQHLSFLITRHEKSIQHIEAMKTRVIWTRNSTIDNSLEQQISKEAEYWRNILHRIIKVILTLTGGNTALRGNEGKKYDSTHTFEEYEGNFMRTIRLLAEFDPLLQDLLNDSNKRIKYLSWKVQNELINILAENLRKIICDEITKCSFFSIILDSTQDITKIDQVSVIIRYVIIEHEAHKVIVKESFLGFFALDKHEAIDYADLIQEVLSKYSIKISNCRGQGYDGASVMSGQYSGVQKRISDIVSTASYVHCCAHNLNLVISDAAKTSLSVTKFFQTIQNVFNFFSTSSPRWTSLALGDEIALNIKKKVLKKVCSTRWESRHTAIYALKSRFIDVLKCLSRLILTSEKRDERYASIALKQKLESSEFVLILCLWEKILRYLNTVSKILQSTDNSLENATILLDTALTNMKNLREDYDTLYSESKQLCDKWDIKMFNNTSRKRFSTKMFDEVDSDQCNRRLDVTESTFKSKVFLPVVDCILFKLVERFNGMRYVLDRFAFLNPISIVKYEESSIIKSSYDFIQFYENDVTSDFTRQILSLKTNILSLNLKTIRDLCTFIIEFDLSSSYPDVLTACLIFLTLPISVASAERSFSKLKLIKNYLRNSSGQDRLSNISILNIERKRNTEINIEKIINDFANAKARKKNFLV